MDGDPALRVLVSGRRRQAFVSGTDISQFQTLTPADGIAYERRISAVLGRLDGVAKPTIAQIEGSSAWPRIAATCDPRGDSESSILTPTPGNRASTGTFGRPVDLVGPARAKEMLFTGRLVSAAEAAAMGLVNRVVPKETIEAEVLKMAREIAGNAPLTIRATKEMTRRILAARRPTESDADLIEMCYMSADFKEGVTAFLSKRRPQWTGT